ncbi:MAG: FtsX-like permease family protein [Acidobacteria bacterium]|nr:FtsX-like permease family protein [Acidobacteriota bacterium]
MWHALRSWSGAKGTATLAVLALAIGIGSATAIFTFVNALLLTPLPYPGGSRYVAIYATNSKDPGHFSFSNYNDLRTYAEQSRSFDIFGWYRTIEYNVSAPGAPQAVVAALATPALVNGIGVQPVLGRWFVDDRGVVLSHSFWQRLGGDPALVGKTITVDRRILTVTGVMGPDFVLPFERPEVAFWAYLDPDGKNLNPYEAWYVAYARRKPDVPRAQAEADLKRIAANIAAEPNSKRENYMVSVAEPNVMIASDARAPLLLMFVAALLLLLLTCANVAGLVLSRSVSRARETAVRVALGASRGALLRQYLGEGLLLAAGGAALGSALSVFLIRWIVDLVGDQSNAQLNVHFDAKALAFALAAAIISTLLFSLAPLWQAHRTQPADALNENVRASAGARTRNLSRALVIAEAGLAFTLLASGLVIVRHLFGLSNTWPGFNIQNLVTFSITVPNPVFRDNDQRVRYQLRLTDELKSVRGADSVAWTNDLPIAGCCFGSSVYPEPMAPGVAPERRMSMQAISPGYFETLGLAPRRGRLLEEADGRSEVIRVVVNERAAKLYWPTRDALGARGRFMSERGSQFEVVGIIGDIKNDGLGKTPEPEFYLLGTQFAWQVMHYVIRSRMPGTELLPEIRRAVQRVDPELPVRNLSTMRGQVRESLILETVSAAMALFFATTALLLAGLGIYGVVAYGVRQRTVEFGTRMALGEERSSIFRLVTRSALHMAGFGIALGLAGTVAVLRPLRTVFPVETTDPPVLIITALIITFVAVFASVLPAWKATWVPPLSAIRNEPESVWSALRRGLTAAFHEEQSIPESPLIAAISQSSRDASSFDEAIQRSLEALRDSVKAEMVELREQGSGFLANRLRYYTRPLPMGKAEFETWERWAAEHKPQYTAELRALRETGATLAVPLESKNVVLLGGRESFSSAERDLLARAAGHLSLLVENGRLTGRVVEQEKVRRDLDLAIEVQQRLLPSRAPVSNDAQFAGVSVPARFVGGDYFDYIDTGDGRLGIVVADIAGKGVAAALIMASVQATLRIVAAEQGLPLAALAAKMNGLLHRTTQSKSYATFFYAQLDGPLLRYVNAGHNPPYVLRAGTDEIVELPAGGTVIGLFPQMKYEAAELPMRPGDVLIAFTDGVTEALNTAEEEYGEDRLKELVKSVAHLPVDGMADVIKKALSDWIGKAEQHDDLTFVVVKLSPRAD